MRFLSFFVVSLQKVEKTAVGYIVIEGHRESPLR